MTAPKIRPLLSLLALGAALAGASPASAQDGLFGFLHFGGSQPQAAPRVSPYVPRASAYAPRVSSSYAPRELRVRPRSVSRPSRPSGGNWARVREPSVAGRDVLMAQKEAYAKLNPSSNPKWYLEDPTLRAGDVVVLKGGIMVYAGGKSAVHQDREFVPLATADTISAAERQGIGKVSVANAN
jgi:hypothetical protein